MPKSFGSSAKEKPKRLNGSTGTPAGRRTTGRLQGNLKEQGKGHGHQGCVVAGGAQHGEEQNAAHKARGDAAGQDSQDGGEAGIRHKQGRGIAAHAEERGAGEVDESRVAELDIDTEHGRGIDEYGTKEEKHVMVVMEEKDEKNGHGQHEAGPEAPGPVHAFKHRIKDAGDFEQGTAATPPAMAAAMDTCASAFRRQMR